MEREPLPLKTVGPDRRYINDRRRRQVAYAFTDRRVANRRETALQAFLWHAQQCA